MKKLLFLTILLTGNLHAQLFSFQSGSGVPTDTAMGGLLGMLIAPMVSKGSDAKLVGALMGAATMNAIATANANVNQYQQQRAYDNSVNTKNFGNHPRYHASVTPDIGAKGIRKGNLVYSPYSRFSFDPSSMNLQSGEVLFDPFTGDPIVVP